MLSESEDDSEADLSSVFAVLPANQSRPGQRDRFAARRWKESNNGGKESIGSRLKIRDVALHGLSEESSDSESWIRPRKLKPKTKKKPGPRKKKPAAKAKKKRGRPKQSSWEEGSDYASDDSFVVRSCSDDELEVQSGSEEEESCGDWSDTDESSSSESSEMTVMANGRCDQKEEGKGKGSEQAKAQKNKRRSM